MLGSQPRATAYVALAAPSHAPEGLGYHSELQYRVLPRNIFKQWNFDGTREGQDGLGLALSGLQTALPINARFMPEPGPVPGYVDPVIMSSGSFISGSMRIPTATHTVRILGSEMIRTKARATLK